ncbi:MAG: hypothetical protein ACLPVY_21445 [Acidimicrobiia bacterium]
MATTVINGLLGYVYWTAAARTAHAAAIGLATAVLSAMTLASLATNPGLHTALVTRLPQRESGRDWSLTLTTAVTVGLASGLVGGLVAALLLPVLASDLHNVGRQPAWLILFPIGVALWTAATILDYAFIAERTASHMLSRNAIFGVTKIVLLAVPVMLGVRAGALGIFVTWTVAGAISVIVSGVFLLTRAGRGWRPVFVGARAELTQL